MRRFSAPPAAHRCLSSRKRPSSLDTAEKQGAPAAIMAPAHKSQWKWCAGCGLTRAPVPPGPGPAAPPAAPAAPQALHSGSGQFYFSFCQTGLPAALLPISAWSGLRPAEKDAAARQRRTLCRILQWQSAGLVDRVRANGCPPFCFTMRFDYTIFHNRHCTFFQTRLTITNRK